MSNTSRLAMNKNPIYSQGRWSTTLLEAVQSVHNQAFMAPVGLFSLNLCAENLDRVEKGQQHYLSTVLKLNNSRWRIVT